MSGECPRVVAEVPHAPHGWLDQVIDSAHLPPAGSSPEFQQCPGYVDPDMYALREASMDAAEAVLAHEAALSPERANRRGDTQGLPTPNDEVDTQTVAIRLIEERRNIGISRYGTALQPGNGRDSMWDAVEEALDMYVYLLNHWRETHPGEDIPNARG